MDDTKLQELGGKLEVSAQDVEALRRMTKEEKRRSRIRKKILIVWSAISAFIGFSLTLAYQQAEDLAYPFSYDRPGGKGMPFIVFTSSAVGVGLFASFRNRTRKSLPQKEMNRTILQTVIASIFIFSMTFLWAEDSAFSSGLLYSVFSKEENRR